MRLRLRLGAPLKLVPEERFTAACENALQLLIDHNGRECVGDYLEFGVYAGTSMRCMFRALDKTGLDHVRLFGFDSFVGLPPSARSDDGGAWMPGMFKSDVRRVAARLERAGLSPARGSLIKGWFEDTLTAETRERLNITHASVIMMDADMYTSTKTALEFCLPVIGQEAVVFFDDWWPYLAERNLGEKKAFDEFLSDHREFSADQLPTEFSADQLSSYKPEARVFLVRRESPLTTGGTSD